MIPSNSVAKLSRFFRVGEAAERLGVSPQTLKQWIYKGTLRTVAPPLKLSGAPPAPARPAPGLGEHTDAVLAEAGFTRADIDKMRGAGVLA